MGRKRPANDSPPSMSPLARRIVVLAKLIWASNISRMSHALGISHPVMSRVLRGRQDPPGKLLEALARWPSVNVRWLFAGEGEPLREHNLGAGGGRFCPIADQLLPGAPADHPELLTWTSLPVADALYSESAYCFKVSENHLITRDKAARVREGDYLYVETSPDWTRKWQAVHGRLCALSVKTATGQEIILGDVARDEEPFETWHTVRTYGACRRVRLFLNSDAMADAIDLPQDGSPDLVLTDVVGVGIMLNRMF